MTTKEWLSRAWNIDVEINELLKEQKQAFESVTGAVPAANGERVQSSGGNTYENRLINYAAYSEKIDARIDELYAVKQEIEAAIGQVDDSTLRAILIMRYLRFYTFEEIAVKMHYSYVHIVHTLHPRALSAVSKFVNSI